MVKDVMPGRGINPMKPVNLPPLSAPPLVSVLIANYNYGDYVGEAIDSVLSQTYPSLEVIVCDDGSTDRSCEVIEDRARRDPRVTFLGKQNGGQASAWNTAFLYSNGQVLCMLDADDTFAPEKLAEVVAYLSQHPSTGFVIHPMMVIDKGGRGIQQIPFMTKFEEGWIAERIVRRGGRWPCMPASALCFRRELADYVFPIPEAIFRLNADGFIFTLLPMLTNVGASNMVLASYRIHGENGLSAFDLDGATVDRLIESIVQANKGVNERINNIGLDGYFLDLCKNLSYAEKLYLRSLLKGLPRRRLVRDLSSFVPDLLKDDLYSRPQKLLGLATYSIPVLLPNSLRSWWLSNALNHSAARAWGQRAMSRLRILNPDDSRR